jgi:hypothetical protein
MFLLLFALEALLDVIIIQESVWSKSILTSKKGALVIWKSHIVIGKGL